MSSRAPKRVRFAAPRRRRRFYKRRYGRRRSAPKYKRRARPTSKKLGFLTMGTHVGLFPERLRVKLRYYHHRPIDLTTSASDSYQYRGSSLFDPDYTGGGHQPYGFDQLANIYRSYIVHGVKVNLSWQYRKGASSAPQQAVVVVDTSDITTFEGLSVGINALLENRTWRKRILKIPLTGASRNGRISFYVSSTRALKMQRNASLDQDVHGALITTNPTENWYINYGVRPLVGVFNNEEIDWNMTLTYYATFYDPAKFAQS